MQIAVRPRCCFRRVWGKNAALPRFSCLMGLLPVRRYKAHTAPTLRYFAKRLLRSFPQSYLATVLRELFGAKNHLLFLNNRWFLYNLYTKDIVQIAISSIVISSHLTQGKMIFLYLNNSDPK